MSSGPTTWTRPVVRRDPDVVRATSVHLTWRCTGAYCGRWTMDGARETGLQLLRDAAAGAVERYALRLVSYRRPFLFF